jgi:uncharacterized membrane protein
VNGDGVARCVTDHSFSRDEPFRRLKEWTVRGPVLPEISSRDRSGIYRAAAQLLSMDPAMVYILVSIVVLAAVSLLLYFTGRKKPEKRLSVLAGLAFAFVIAGILFGEDPLVGYTLLGIGVALALTDIYLQLKSR